MKTHFGLKSRHPVSVTEKILAIPPPSDDAVTYHMVAGHATINATDVWGKIWKLEVAE